MATFRATVNNGSENGQIIFRIRSGDWNLYYKTGINIRASYFDNKTGKIKPNARIDAYEKASITEKLDNIKQILPTALENLKASTDDINSENYTKYVNAILYPVRFAPLIDNHFEQWYNEFKFDHSNDSAERMRDYRVLHDDLIRWEIYRQRHGEKLFTLDFSRLTSTDVTKFSNFLRDEHLYQNEEKMQDIYSEIPKIVKRSKNTIIKLLRVLRTFNIYLLKREHITNNLFLDFSIPTPVYGTPFYLTMEERNRLATYDFSDNPTLDLVRDIFIFQCYIGCRQSDLWTLKKANVQFGMIEYIPKKTKNQRATIVRVPLTEKAKEIIAKHHDDERDTLFPTITKNKYNYEIKNAFKQANLTRYVTILNDGNEVQKPLYEVASSHIARRTFIGLLYNKTKDPNIIASMSGHVEGSKAFARYRVIEDDAKKELIKMLD